MADPEDEDDDALSDEQVYDLLHAAKLSLSNKVVETPLGQDVITVAITQLDRLQLAMVAVMDGVSFPPAATDSDELEKPTPPPSSGDI